MGVIAGMADRVQVMRGTARSWRRDRWTQVFYAPRRRHDYTAEMLLAAVPRLDREGDA